MFILRLITIEMKLSNVNMPFLKLESAYENSREAMGPLTTRVESYIASIQQRGVK